MASTPMHIGDDVLRNILARLPGKNLLQLRCVSKHWNHLISDPFFMKSRSRRMILLPYTRPLMVIDDNVPAEDEAHSMVRIPSPLKHEKGTHVSIVGTLNGIVILSLHDPVLRCHLILYNPLTSASKVLVVMDPPSCGYPYAFGFDGLKIYRLEVVEHPPHGSLYKCDVFDLKTSSWSMPPLYGIRDFILASDVGMFLNGTLYWSAYFPLYRGIIALNVKEMRISKIYIPRCQGLILGSLDGCLCTIYHKEDGYRDITYDMQLMKEEGVWFKARSFSFGSDRWYRPIGSLGDGKVLIIGKSHELVIYDTLKDSYKALKGLAKLDVSVTGTDWTFGFNHEMYVDYPLKYSRPIEYVESLVSPSDICFI